MRDEIFFNNWTNFWVPQGGLCSWKAVRYYMCYISLLLFIILIIYGNAGQISVSTRQRLNNQRPVNTGWWAADDTNIAGGVGLPRGGMLRISVSLHVVRRCAEAKTSLSWPCLYFVVFNIDLHSVMTPDCFCLLLSRFLTKLYCST
jgi:hypothetical protein